MRIIGTMVYLVSIAACASSPSQAGWTMTTNAQQIPLGNGMNAWEISCDGMAHSVGTCLKRAGEVCPEGFDFLNSSEGTAGGVIVPNTAIGGASVVPVVKRSIIVACKPAP
jgi:hypothetical protein